jgi:hypothetical protein
LKEFDALFFEFFDKKSNPSLLLTKQEFYTYTIQIAIFQIDWRHCIQIKRNCCYKQKKWFAEAYEDLFESISKKISVILDPISSIQKTKP